MKRLMVLMKWMLPGVVILVLLLACNPAPKTDDAASTTPLVKPDTELLDMSLAEPVRRSFDAFTRGDLDGFTSEFDDNIRYTWSNGDSLRGKQAVKDYYAARLKMMDSINFSDHIFLPMQINVSQSKSAAPGRWILSWSSTHIKYKNGKKLDFWIHQVSHYSDAGKVDFVGQYMDRHPIMEATKDMMKK